MRLIEPSFEIWKQEPGLEGIYKAIERAGRVCYKSEDKITEDSAKPFVDRMDKAGHWAMLEHGTVYLAIPMTTYAPEAVNIYHNNSYSKVNECNEFIFTDKYGDKVAAWCVTTNLRVLVENDCLEDLEFLCEPTEYHEKRITVRFICSRSIANKFVRHRVFSFEQEGQIYCNYSKDKFNNEITYIMPSWIPYKGGEYEILEGEDGWGNYAGEYIIRNNKPLDEYDPDYRELFPFLKAIDTGEIQYFKLLSLGCEPQQAIEVLPNACKTELVMTGFVSDWKNFFDLRCPADVHPSAQELTISLREEFIKREYINE